ncbi:MAG: acyl-CoA dehydrogenase family protein, partial [Reyranellaceae bacterium]
VDEGFSHVVATLNGERLNCAGVATGIARGAWQAALEYSRQRQAFGKSIGQFQALQHRLVQAGIAIEAGWLLALRAAEEDEAGRPADIAASMAKYAASQAALQATHVGMEIMGGAGFDLRSPMQRWFRDARLYVFAPHTNDMSLNYLGERWLGLPRSF